MNLQSFLLVHQCFSSVIGEGGSELKGQKDLTAPHLKTELLPCRYILLEHGMTIYFLSGLRNSIIKQMKTLADRPLLSQTCL